ncbi:Calx-beta domain-containing protein [Tautonia marina]|uniref:Calx-beta domain-containing protein n=1 Tax=Tautonia marina TaxID=2653855 RepID=UPI001260A0E7|nr:Calx-beta domain-containing protein [Tautonia marina]
MTGHAVVGRGRRRRFRAGVERVEPRCLLATFFVINTEDAGAGSLRAAMQAANANPGADHIEFAIPTSTAPGLNVPVPGFDLGTQTWRIELESPLPVLTDPVTIDGLSQADVPVAFFYPDDIDEPTTIQSEPNSVAALNGNNAALRVIVDGSGIDRNVYPEVVGFELATKNSNLRGLIIDGFDIGVRVPDRSHVGNRIQGNSIGGHFLFRVDLQTGDPLPAPGDVSFQGAGISGDAIVVAGTNTTIGGFNAQENNTITLAGGRGIWIQPGAEGNQVFGNQIGVIGPTRNGVYVQAGNDLEGILIESSDDQLASSNAIGGPEPGSGNVISANGSHGVWLDGPGATRNRIEGNYIGAAPGGGYRFGAGNPGNAGDGVFVDNAPSNRIGANEDGRRNTIAANGGAGVRLSGPMAFGNLVAGNFIGTTSDGNAALGNAREGVRVELSASGNTIGEGNVISANLRGVAVVGATTRNTVIANNRIGSSGSGQGDLGNAKEGVRIDGAPDTRVIGDGDGSQIISGNNVGVAILGPTATGNLVAGSFIGTDPTGLLELNNSLQGVLIENAPGNTIGGTTTEARNLISSNHWGVDLVGAGTVNTVVQGNLIGTDLSGTLALSNEVDGVRIRDGASNNLIGGTTVEAGNVIAFSRRDGVRVEGPSIENRILTNSIFDNAGLGINLVEPLMLATGPNLLRPAPVIDRVRTSTDFANIEGSLTSVPNTAFVIQFFANETLDPSGNGEGKRYLGETVVTTNGAGVAVYSADVPGAVLPGEFVTATATDAAGNTSEFSAGVAELLGTVQFAMAVYEVDESSGEAVIAVTRTGGSGGQATVAYATMGGSAVPGVDYSPVSGTLTFDIGVNQQTFTVPILDDDLAEAVETVGLVLSSPAGAADLGDPSTAILRIVDNDQPGTIAFASPTFVVSEETGEATITVVRSAGGGSVSIEYDTRAGTAVPGVDYLPVSGTLTFGPGQLVQTFTVPILFNPGSQGSPMLGLFLDDPMGGASLGVPSSAVLTITNLEVPRVASVVPQSDRRGFLTIAIGFDRDMNGPRAEDLRNYGYSVQVPGHNRRIGTREDLLVPLGPPVYDPATRTVTLRTLKPVRPGTPVQILINQVTGIPGAGVGVADENGVLLDGDGDGRPGGTFSTVFRSPRPTPVPRPWPPFQRPAWMFRGGRLG